MDHIDRTLHILRALKVPWPSSFLADVSQRGSGTVYLDGFGFTRVTMTYFDGRYKITITEDD